MAQVRIAVAFFFLGAAACGGKLAPVDELEPPRPNPTTDPGPTQPPHPPSPYPTTYPVLPPSTSSSSSSGDLPPAPYVDAGLLIVDAGVAPPPVPDPGPPVTESWTFEPSHFTVDHTTGACSGGEQYVRYSARYGLWVGLALCSSTRYKIYLGATVTGPYDEVADWAGSGEDHCELVNPAFTNPSEDDIQAACPSCDLGPDNSSWPGPYEIYARGWFGDDFTLQTWPETNYYSPAWYECGVSIP